MKKTILNIFIKLIAVNNPAVKDLEIIRYGLEGIYLSISKLIIIMLFCFGFGIIWEFIIFTILFNLIRLFAFGAHLNNSFSCLLFSCVIFTFMPLLSIHLSYNYLTTFLFGLPSLISVILFAPADTPKRPILKYGRRFIYKLFSIILTLFYLIFSLYASNNFLSNCIVFSLMIEALLITPFFYKIFGISYKNYEHYTFKKGGE